MKGFNVPDIIWPSSNKFGIPDLLPEMQATELYKPLVKWGEISRSAKMAGTYHFYTEDYKFEKVWRDPMQPVRTGARALVECNFSTGNLQPLAVSLWDIYRKRWLSRFWQSELVQIFVDLNVDKTLKDYSLLGVPKGWYSYATRALSSDFTQLFDDYELAKSNCGNEPLFLVYGGGNIIENICKDRGWLWEPENMHRKDGRRINRPWLQLRTLELYYG